MVGLEADCKELLQNSPLETITLINNNGRDDWTSSLPQTPKGTSHPRNIITQEKTGEKLWDDPKNIRRMLWHFCWKLERHNILPRQLHNRKS